MKEDQQEILALLKEGADNQLLEDWGVLSPKNGETWTSFEFRGQKYDLPREKWNRLVMLTKKLKPP